MNGAETAHADALMQALQGASLLAPSHGAQPGVALDLPGAYRVAAELERRRIAAGDRPAGWKIGFTNRSIWPRYGVQQPIWGRVWRSSLTLLEGTAAEVSLAGLVQPRIEPEVVFGIGRTPPAGLDAPGLRDCIAWVAHGVEIVHTHHDGWRFASAAEPVADFGLHGRLLVGPRLAVDGWATLGADLAAMTMALLCGDEEVDRGHGALVLDGPLNALRLGLQALAEQAPFWQLQAGDVVTTGTLTDAWPVAPGQAWRTRPGDARLAGLDLRFTG
jgi:2-keto-4-pentenoate hydratase